MSQSLVENRKSRKNINKNINLCNTVNHDNQNKSILENALNKIMIKNPKKKVAQSNNKLSRSQYVSISTTKDKKNFHWIKPLEFKSSLNKRP